MTNEFSDLILQIDTREKAQSRIDSMQSFFESRGACVEYGAISINEGYLTSMDYALSGSYNGKEISLAISAKTMVDFSATIGKLKDELARGYLRFEDVGFILVTGCYQTSLADGSLHAVVTNPGATAKNQDDRANVLNLTSMFNALESWQMCGIHCRQILYEEDFPKAVMSILTYISKDHHEGIGFDTKQFSGAITKSKQELKSKLDFVNAHIHLGVEGFGVKTALKLREYLISSNYPPNLHFSTSLSEDDLQDAVGKKTGSALFQAYNCRDGWVEYQSNAPNSNPEPSQATPQGELTPKSDCKQDGIKSLKSPKINPKQEDITNSNKSHKDYKSQSSVIRTNESHTERSSSSSENPNLDSHDTEGKFKDRLSELLPSGLQSSASHHLLAVDPAEGTILGNRPPIQSPKSSAGNFHEVRAKETIKSLEDAVVDYVYEAPKSDTEVMNTFMMRGFKMPEIHKTIKESPKLRKYKQGNGVMIAFHGVRADVPMDVGV